MMLTSNSATSRQWEFSERTSSAQSHSALANPAGRSTTNQSGAAIPLILFDVHKKESRTPTNGLKQLQRRLRSKYKVSQNKDEVSLQKIFESSLIIFCGPREKLMASEFSALKSYMDIGGSILYLCGEGGESQSNSNFNYLLEEYGISVNSDAVARTIYHKYFHPKEVFIANGVLNREINRAAGKRVDDLCVEQSKSSSLSFVFPFGSSLNVQKPAIPILSSGNVSYPLNRPIGAVYSNPNGKGKLAVIGSTEIFSDQYIDKEENGKLFDVLVQWLTSDTIQLNAIDGNEPDIADYHYIPDTPKLSEELRACLQETEELPKDFTKMFDHKLFKFDLGLIPQAIRLYDVSFPPPIRKLLSPSDPFQQILFRTSN